MWTLARAGDPSSNGRGGLEMVLRLAYNASGEDAGNVLAALNTPEPCEGPNVPNSNSIPVSPECKTYPNLLSGKAGEYRVASELLLRGHRPCINIVDTGCDMVLETGITIQVKTSRLIKDKTRNATPCYHFQLCHWKKGKRHDMQGIDYVIMFGIETNDFWIVPVKIIGPVTVVSVYPSGREPKITRPKGPNYFRRGDYFDRWDLLDVKP